MHNDGINLIRANNNSGKGEDSGLIATIKTLLKSLDFKWGGRVKPPTIFLAYATVSGKSCDPIKRNILAGGTYTSPLNIRGTR